MQGTALDRQSISQMVLRVFIYFCDVGPMVNLFQEITSDLSGIARRAKKEASNLKSALTGTMLNVYY